MKIRIYQIDMKEDKNRVRFEGYDDTIKFQGKNDPSIYQQVYGGEVDCKDLEEVFIKFNNENAPGFCGNNLSVSDIVEICDGENQGYHFVNNFGFTKFNFDSKQIIDNDIIKVLIFEPKKEPYEAEIQNKYEAIRSVVEGTIGTAYYFKDNAFIFCNDEYRLGNYEGNRYVENVPFAGNFMIVGDKGNGENCSLTDEQLQKYADLYREPSEDITQDVLEEDMGFIIVSF